MVHQPRGDVRQERAGQNAHGGKDCRAPGEGREHDPEREDRPQVGDEARAENPLAVVCPVESGLQHHRVDDRHRGGGEGDPTQPTGLDRPAEHVPGGCRAAEEGDEEEQAEEHAPEGAAHGAGADQMAVVLDVRLAVEVAHDFGGVLQLDDHVLLHLGQLEAETVGFDFVLEAQDHQFTHTRSLGRWPLGPLLLRAYHALSSGVERSEGVGVVGW